MVRLSERQKKKDLGMNGLYRKLSSLCSLESGLQFSTFSSLIYLLLRDHIQGQINASPVTRYVVSSGRGNVTCCLAVRTSEKYVAVEKKLCI